MNPKENEIRFFEHMAFLFRVHLRLAAFLSLLLLCAGSARADDAAYPPKGFVFVRDMIPDAALDIRYFGENNFIGARVDGYEAPQALLSVEAAAALKAAGNSLRKKGYGLKIFDAYRPSRAVRHFVRWAEDLNDIRMKVSFYPDVDKAMLFSLGYIASRSGHSRGSVVDATLIDLKSGQEADMGSPFDFFGKISHHGAVAVTSAQAENRAMLREAMEAHGFVSLKEEWWHYRLKDEPYPKIFFDFPVHAPMRVDAATQQALEKLADGANRLLVVTDGKKNRALVHAYAKADGAWSLRFSTDGWLGKNGFSKDKREGDGATPVGAFTFDRAFGNAGDPGVAAFPYTKVSPNDVWVDDPASKSYNQWARADAPDADWSSAERLADYKKQYRYALSIGYNTAPVVPGKGSAIFLHVATGRPTAGCVAVPEAAMVFFLSFVERNTRIVLTPSLEGM
ncbi:MAG: L,D-transpeptidase family protein [Azoarcus sp.]|jgi:D-alanyl-D-alanine dipeptidase/L,D-peptidoglycan transpeptidase YkuD (ErfK/YbiS/YcfS/YnhG family)|nr:L,D-transpeptidase family protein [Azoarcus sp.]